MGRNFFFTSALPELEVACEKKNLSKAVAKPEIFPYK
jgi:hypothetical protein